MESWLVSLRLTLLLSSFACGREPELAPERELVVFAATSLRDAFTSLGESWKVEHPGVTLTFNFAGTQELRTQLEHGAQADVFASADSRHMAALVQAGRVSEPHVIARNEPVIVVAQEAAQRIHAWRDLTRAQRLVVGGPEVPIGRYTQQILDKLGAELRAEIERKIVSRELNVRQVLNKVKLGEADAGLVYRSDALSAPELRMIALPSELNVTAEYPIARVTGAAHPKLAHTWLSLVRSDEGRRALQRAGLIAPERELP